ncbi:uncharacterized protein LOC128209618 isoform X2 [Mya arenaria]|nr:uncharacterized protein LOC128209618 isoform X2 [Mya arenaria]XP_052769687.1 uncharacterized protein LOC128209618 isoform X2 [Mya arenaria]XP_052769688.1 uncharacterized protein LOC128209618 isoform X2 [Mya arenaria]
MVQRRSTMANDNGPELKTYNYLKSFFEGPKLSEEDMKLPMWQRFKLLQDMRAKDPAGARNSAIFFRCLLLFQAPTQLYVFIAHIVPFFFGDYGPWVEYYMKVFVAFVFFNGMANWLCVILYDPGYYKTKDNPNLQLGNFDQPPDQFVPLIEQSSNGMNGHCVYDLTAKEGLPWEFCNECEMYIPPRSKHCKHCKKCILKRDHHCFMVGNCIGFKNQRYFFVLAFYALITGLVGGYFTYKYIQIEVWPHMYSWTYLIPPVTVVQTLFGQLTIFECLLVFHVILEFLFGTFGFIYFTSQLTVVALGKTLYELSRQTGVKSSNSINRNFRSVFGDFWLLNFIFPMTLIFRQRDDGIHWEGIKIDYNGNEKKNEDANNVI